MTDPKPPRWLKPVNKVMIGLQKLGIPTGPPMVLTVPGRKYGQPHQAAPVLHTLCPRAPRFHVVILTK